MFQTEHGYPKITWHVLEKKARYGGKMEFVYMGIFSTVFKWYLTKYCLRYSVLLQNQLVIYLVFNNVLMPLLTAVFKPLILFTFSLLKQIWCGVCFQFTTILKVIDYLGTAFDYDRYF